MDSESTPAAEILLVEDDRDVREAIAEVLEQEGYVVSVAKNGIDALEMLQTAQPLPAVILLDLMMPVMDGWQFTAAQQKNAQWASIPVVILSADSHVGEKAESLHAAAHLRKPIQLDQLLATLGPLARRTDP
jgi:two-component system, chemotaxis family, chemotaxis protein CheY